MNKKYKWIILTLIFLLLFSGVYLYNFFPQLIPGLATDNLEINRDINVLILGVDDRKSVKKDSIEIDAIIMTQYKSDDNIIKLNSISPEIEVDGNKLKKYSINNLRNKIEKLTNVKEEYYFVISYEGFIKFIDEIGGVPIDLNEKMVIPDLNLDLKKGKNVLSGKEALNYIRWYNYDQFKVERLKRQEKLINTVKDKVISSNYLTDIPKLYSTIVESYKMVKTNMDQRLISDLVKLLQKNEKNKIKYKITANK